MLPAEMGIPERLLVAVFSVPVDEAVIRGQEDYEAAGQQAGS